MSKDAMTRIDREQVKAILKEKGLSQKKLCEILEPTEFYPGGLTQEYFSRCLKNGEISVKLMDAIAKQLDVAPDCLCGKTDLRKPYHLSRAEADYYQMDKSKLVSGIIGLSTLHQVELTDLDPEDQAALLKMLELTSLYFLKGKGYLENTGAQPITDGQLLDRFHEILGKE